MFPKVSQLCCHFEWASLQNVEVGECKNFGITNFVSDADTCEVH